MKSKHIPGLVFAFLMSSCAFAQVTEGTKVGINSGRGFNSLKSDVFWTSPTEAPDVIGDFYIDSLWHEGKVKFTSIIPQLGGWNSDSLSGIMVRYNVLNDELEVLADKSKNDVRVIKGTQLKQFSLNSGEELYINASAFKADKPLKGFAKVLAEGKLTLIEHFYPKITKPNYNPGFATGQKNTIVRQGTDYYFVVSGTAQKASLSKKNVMALMKDKEREIEAYAKDQNINFKSEDDVIRLIGFYNQSK